MVTEYRTDRGIETAGDNYKMWQSSSRIGGWVAAGIVVLLLIMFFTLT